MSWSYWFAGTDAHQPRYNQFDYAGCAVGCGPVAWAMLFCWADFQAHNGNSYWAPRTGLFRADGGRGADAAAPLDQTEGVNNAIREIRNQVGTFCAFGSGATPPWSMSGASNYLNGRTAARLETHWNSVGIHEGYLADKAIQSIRDRRTPAVIGTGWLSHYPLAYGYAEERRVVRNCFLWHCWDEVQYTRCFKVNNGWGRGGWDAEWIPASTWFAGLLFP